MKGITGFFSALILSAVVAGSVSAMPATAKVGGSAKTSKTELTHHRHKVAKHRRGKLHKKTAIRKLSKDKPASK